MASVSKLWPIGGGGEKKRRQPVFKVLIFGDCLRDWFLSQSAKGPDTLLISVATESKKEMDDMLLLRGQILQQIKAYTV